MESGLYTQFLECLMANEETFDATKQAVAGLAEAYHFTRFTVRFYVPDTIYTENGEDTRREFLFGSGEYEESVKFEKVIHTSEGGTVTLSVYSARGQKGWTENEKRDLDNFMCIYCFHGGRSRLAAMVRRSALVEHMTGLPNVNGFFRRLTELLEQGTLKNYNSYYFNLKGFSLVNRFYSQQEGDKIICRYARRLQSFIDGEECIGRLGGDNFVALIRKERTEAFLKLLEGVEIDAFREEVKETIVVSAVAGILDIKDSFANPWQAISECAVALNLAKNVYKCPYLFASKELENRVYMEKNIRSSFPAAIAGREFVVYYQPKVETEHYTMVGAEALVRWAQNGKIVAPGDFIPVIEQNGMICQLDFYVLDLVCRHISSWREKGIQPVRTSVNFSRKHLSNRNVVDDILKVLDHYEIEHQYIEIEITETVSEEEHGLLTAFLHGIKENGLYAAIDDFGTGYSSLNILRLLPVDVLKIDKSFIDSMVVTKKDKIVLENIVHMAKQLDMEVITEGVEHWQQVEFLREIHCNMVQGYLFDRPMPVEQFEERLKMPRYETQQK